MDENMKKEEKNYETNIMDKYGKEPQLFYKFISNKIEVRDHIE